MQPSRVSHSTPCVSDVHDMVGVSRQIQVVRSGASQPAVAYPLEKHIEIYIYI